MLAAEHHYAGEVWLDPVVSCSGVVAVCRYGGFVTVTQDMTADEPDPWFEGPYGWRLDGLFVLPDPVPCKGAQGLWDLPHDVQGRVRIQCPEAFPCP